MLKIIIISIAIVAAGAGVYYGRFFFTKKVVREDIPKDMQASVQTTFEGEFRDIDFIHKGSGKAKLLKDAAGRQFLRLENFQVTNGPDLYVYLSKNPEPKDKNSLGDFVSLGRLKGNIGDQNYETNQDLTDYRTVVIWCQRFGVLFSFAVLK